MLIDFFSESCNFSIVGECSKFGNFQFLTKKIKIYIFNKKNKIPELWTAIKYAKIIAMTNVRVVLKRSCQGLLNGDKQKIPNGLIDNAIKA